MPAAATGANAAGGIVSGSYVSNYNGTNLGPVTIDKRTLSTNYNVLDNYMKAEENLVRGGFEWSLRPDVVMYIASALDTFAKMDVAKRRQITLEIALKGQTGLDINGAEAKYTLKSLPGQFSGMHLISIMYVGMKELDPDMDSGVDLSAEYDAAKLMQNKN